MTERKGPVAYIGIIEVVGKRLYSGKITWLREYLQNSIDAGATKISVALQDNDLEISDNGQGMDSESLSSQAFSIGKSFKGPKEIGELGVGIFAGSGICDRIQVLTQMTGKTACVATIDMQKFKQINKSNPSTSFESGMEEIFHVKDVPKGLAEAGSYTKIRFQDINRDTIELIKKVDIAKFIEHTIDLPIDEEFKHKTAVEKFLGKGQQAISVTVSLNGHLREIKKFALTTAKLTDTFWQKDVVSDGHIIAKIWACYSKEGTAIEDARILLKRKGFTVGGETIVQSRFGAKFAPRFYGEIVLLDDRIEINTSRDWFLSSAYLDSFVAETKKGLSELHGIASFDSSMGVGLENIVEAKQKLEGAVLDSRESGNWGIARQKVARIMALDRKIENKLADLKEFKKKADQGSIDLSHPTEKMKYELAKRTLSNEEVRRFERYQEGGDKGTTTSTKRKSPFPQIVMTFLREKVIDASLADRIGTRGDIKDTTDRGFTFIEQKLKMMVGRKEHEHVDWDVLVKEFKAKFKPVDLKGATMDSYMKAFDGIMNGFHTILRNPSSHSFMDEVNDSRSILQVILVADFIVRWLDQWEPRPASGS